MHFQYLIIVLVFISHSFGTSFNVTNELVVLFQSQPHIYILSQIHNASSFIDPSIPLLYSHSFAEEFVHWYALYPLFSSIVQRYPLLKWLFISESQTRFNLTQLLQFADEQNRQSKSIYVGRGLYDSEPSIIHHYSLDFDNPYPDFSAGLLISRDILQRLIDRLRTHQKPVDFIIDVKYELNQLIFELTGEKFTDRSDLFCYERRPSCLTWLDGSKDYSCQRKDIQLNHLYFGIKTFSDFHRSRVELLKKTWLTQQLSYDLFTDRINEKLDDPNERFVQTKENTLRGHCHKTFFIMNHFYEHQTKYNYLILADDDTLLSIPRLVRLIRCLMLSNDIPIILGERYGYGEYYDYPTGGSGIVFNRRAVQQIIVNCHCPSADTPDDMFLGICMKRLQIPLIHINEFHQAQPNAYDANWLKQQKPISFHKFDGIDVEQIYRTYLEDKMFDSFHIKDEF